MAAQPCHGRDFRMRQFLLFDIIKTHDSESRGQEEAGRTRDEQVSYLHVAPL